MLVFPFPEIQVDPQTSFQVQCRKSFNFQTNPVAVTFYVIVSFHSTVKHYLYSGYTFCLHVNFFQTVSHISILMILRKTNWNFLNKCMYTCIKSNIGASIFNMKVYKKHFCHFYNYSLLVKICNTCFLTFISANNSTHFILCTHGVLPFCVKSNISPISSFSDFDHLGTMLLLQSSSCFEIKNGF